MFDAISQVGILLFGCTAVWLVGRKEDWRRWGFVLGLCSQPFWLYSSIAHHQWGVAALSVWYAYAWAQGIYNYWVAPRNNAQIVVGSEPAAGVASP